MINNLKGYFYIYSQPYTNIYQHTKVINIISIYQLFDMIITIVDASTQKMDGTRIMLIVRIIVQAVLLILFWLIFNCLRKFRNGFLNVATFIYFISLSICWTETDYYLFYELKKPYSSYTAEIQTLLLGLVLLQESQICQTISLLFSLFYSLFRIQLFQNKIDILSSIRIVLIHIAFQIFLLQLPQKKKKLNNQLVMLGQQSKNYVPIQSNRQSLPNQQWRLSTYLNQQDYEIKKGLTQQFKENEVIVSEENRLDTERQNLDQFYENVLNNIQIGIFVLDNLQTPVKSINPYMSHLVLKDDQLSDEFLNSEIFDFGIAFEDNLTVLPKFHRSKDIGNFIKFMQTLEQSINYENGNIGLKEVQFFHKSMKIKTLIEHLLPFQHFKFNQCQNLIDFSLKIYLKQDNLYTCVVLSPILQRHKPQLILFVSDLTDEPFMTQLNQFNQNSDLLVSDISQKIKQPLNCTISMLEITIHSVPFEIQEKFLNPALAGCKLLISTANDILDYVTIRKKGKLELCQMDVHVREFITDSINIIKQQALFRGLQIQVNVRHNVPAFFRTDPNRLRQILLNLLVSSIQATINGTIVVSASKSTLIQDHIELVIKVHALEMNQSVLKTIDKTVRFFKSQNLLTSTMIDLANAGRKYSQSILIAFCLSLSISTIPFEYHYEKNLDHEEFCFIIQIQNKNPNFSQQLNFKRQSALSIQQLNFKQSYQIDQGFKRHQSSRQSLFDKAIIALQGTFEKQKFKQQALQQQKLQSQSQILATQSQRKDSGIKLSTSFGQQNQSRFIVPRTSQGDIDVDFLPTFKTIKSQDQSKKIKQMISHSKSDISIVSEQNSKESKGENESSHNSLDVGVQLDKFLYNESGKIDEKDSPLVIMQQSINYTYNNNLTASKRDSVLTFGGRSSIFSSMRYSASIMQPNDLIDCFEKMEKIKQQKYNQKCQCPKILICEQNDFDLYAVSHQLGNIGMNFDYTMQRSQIHEKLKTAYEIEKSCCKGYQLIFISVEFVDEELSEQCNLIKNINSQFKKEARIIGLIGFQDDENRIAIKKLPFHDFLSKPLMIDALLFILAKWVKL
ncbi:unnamed protein product [Paramecium primaurelia]|uniref:histidine kinase n=1 Tax=Paramecium primaurelia TaxID=5886 RepID=A0A8S1L9A6_PARPR|nr:unnamed protein product [Paramecium primaurelia]